MMTPAAQREAMRQALALTRAVLDADNELGVGTVLVESDAIDPHALLCEAVDWLNVAIGDE